MLEPVIYKQHGNKIVLQRVFNKCNNKCIFCCDCLSKKDKKRVMTTDEALKTIDKYPQDIKTIAFTTTEPTIRKDFFTILKYTKRKFPNAEIEIMTNGRMFYYKKYAKAFGALSLSHIKVCIPIHAHQAKQHDFQTGVSGSFLQTITGIKNILEYTNYPVEIRVLISRLNYKNLEKIATTIIRLHDRIKRVVFVHISITGRAEMSKNLGIKFSEFMPHLVRAVNILEKKFEIGIYHVPLCVLPRRYWRYTNGMTAPRDTLIFPTICEKCNVKMKCSGLWNCKSVNELMDDLKPVEHEKNLPEEVDIELTKKCNLNCAFCFGKNQKNCKLELTTNQIFSTIDKIKNSGIEAIRFTGGEPFLRRDLRKILKYARRQGLYVILNTNGTLINDENIRVLKNLDSILISFHDIEGAEEKLKLFEKIKSKTPEIFLMACTIATKRNILNMEKFYMAIQKSPVNDWFILRPVPIPENKTPINRKYVKILVEKILKFNEKYSVKTHIANALPFCSYDIEKVRMVCIGGRNDDGHTRIVIDSRGDIKPSYYIDKKLGNIMKDSIMGCWNHKFMRKMRNLDFVPTKCRACDFIDDCKGGLRFAAKINNGAYESMEYLIEEAQPHVSVIVSTYNRKNTLKLVLSSLFKQNYPKDRFEIVVSDDGSNDGTDDLIGEMKKISPCRLKHVPISHDGFRVSRTRNFGAKNSKGEILIFINDDIVVSTNFIKKHVFSLKRADVVLGHCASYGSNDYYKKKFIREKINRCEEIPQIPEFRDNMFKHTELRNSITNEKIWYVFLAANFSIKREIFFNNMFNESFVGWGCEDVELGYRLYKGGFNIFLDKKCLGFHVSKEKMYSKNKVKSLLSGLQRFYELHPQKEVNEYIIDRCIHLPSQFKQISKHPIGTKNLIKL